jgi:hypothetical protein
MLLKHYNASPEDKYKTSKDSTVFILVFRTCIIETNKFIRSRLSSTLLTQLFTQQTSSNQLVQIFTQPTFGLYFPPIFAGQ